MKLAAKDKQNSSSWKTPGQKGAKLLLHAFLDDLNQATLPHAFLFLGPRGIGKGSLAREFAEKIFQALSERPEIFEHDYAVGEGVESFRDLTNLSSLTSLGSKKIFILKNFDQASPAALNSLLKTLEEPTASSMFILVSNSNGVLPTIASRTVMVRCFPVVNAEPQVQLPRTLQELLVGYPDLAEHLAAQKEEAELIAEHLQSLEKKNLNLLISLSELTTEQLQLLLQLWIERLRITLRNNESLAKVIHNIQAATQARYELSKSYNTKLVLQQFLLETKI